MDSIVLGAIYNTEGNMVTPDGKRYKPLMTADTSKILDVIICEKEYSGQELPKLYDDKYVYSTITSAVGTLRVRNKKTGELVADINTGFSLSGNEAQDSKTWGNDENFLYIPINTNGVLVISKTTFSVVTRIVSNISGGDGAVEVKVTPTKIYVCTVNSTAYISLLTFDKSTYAFVRKNDLVLAGDVNGVCQPKLTVTKYGLLIFTQYKDVQYRRMWWVFDLTTGAQLASTTDSSSSVNIYRDIIKISDNLIYALQISTQNIIITQVLLRKTLPNQIQIEFLSNVTIYIPSGMAPTNHFIRTYYNNGVLYALGNNAIVEVPINAIQKTGTFATEFDNVIPSTKLYNPIGFGSQPLTQFVYDVYDGYIFIATFNASSINPIMIQKVAMQIVGYKEV